MSNPSQNTAPNPASGTESDAKLHAMLLVTGEQVSAAADKVNLLASMGLTRTMGYQEAVSFYETKLKAYNDLKARLQRV